jgi:hypothetical protein
MKQGYIPQAERKKILLISDDLRFTSGVGVMSREIVLKTAHHYNWSSIGAAVVHPEQGRVMDASDAVNKEMGLTDSYVRIYPNNGYGDANLVRGIMQAEQPDAIMIFTDPRYFIWLFHLEHELRERVPLIYLNIWDDTPAPMYNFPYYASCDALFAISKQTYNINKVVLGDNVNILKV